MKLQDKYVNNLDFRIMKMDIIQVHVFMNKLIIKV